MGDGKHKWKKLECVLPWWLSNVVVGQHGMETARRVCTTGSRAAATTTSSSLDSSLRCAPATHTHTSTHPRAPPLNTHTHLPDRLQRQLHKQRLGAPLLLPLDAHDALCLGLVRVVAPQRALQRRRLAAQLGCREREQGGGGGSAGPVYVRATRQSASSTVRNSETQETKRLHANVQTPAAMDGCQQGGAAAWHSPVPPPSPAYISANWSTLKAQPS